MTLVELILLFVIVWVLVELSQLVATLLNVPSAVASAAVVAVAALVVAAIRHMLQNPRDD